MKKNITGIHHITAVCGDPQKNLEFYSGILGLRLVKKTVNFDDPGTYHLYYGDEAGNPGTLLTFFPWVNLPANKPGSGEACAIAFTVPKNSLSYWSSRLRRFNVSCKEPETRMDGKESYLAFEDPDGIQLELVETANSANQQLWKKSPVPADYAIGKLHSVALTIEEIIPTIELLTQTMGFRSVGEEQKRKRYECGDGGPSTYIDLIYDSMAKPGQMGRGGIHHVAFRVSDKKTQLLMRESLNAYRLSVTHVIDRDYFHSIYFREPGGVLFELATDAPGFTKDEPLESLGTELKLPDQHKAQESRIRDMLPELNNIDLKAFRD